MPCLSGEEKDSGYYSRDYHEIKDKLDQVTRLLCDLTARIPKKYIESDSELGLWVAEHAEIDRKRQEAEQKLREHQKAQLKTRMKDLEQQMVRARKELEKLK